MLAVALLLLPATHCADPGFCPTQAEFREAVWRHEEAGIVAGIQAEPGSITHVTVHRKRDARLTDFYCSAPYGEPQSVNCMATTRQRDGTRIFSVTRLSRGAGGWQVEEALYVSRP